MIKTEQVKPVSNKLMEEAGMSWHTDVDGTAYLVNELVPVTEDEAEAYYEAANTLYDMFIAAGQHVIDNELFFELDIPFNLISQIKRSWDNDDLHLYGRFDFAGGLDGLPIKLIEFNADTPTSLFETAVVQWALLKANGMNEASQFNTVYDAIQQNFRRLITGLDDDTSDFSNQYQYQNILFSSMPELPEDERTVKFLQQIAADAGFQTDFAYMGDVSFSEEDGIFSSDAKFDYWFKLFPWEDIALETDGITGILEDISRNQACTVLNPAYTLLFQSKGIMKVLYELFPDSPYLLETRVEPLQGKKQVSKTMFGREGANTVLYDAMGKVLKETPGEYDNYNKVYQEFAEFPQDEEGRSYQAGVFFAWEGCGLAFRRAWDIHDDMSKFVSHRIV